MKRIVISGAVLALAISGVGVASAEKPSDKGNNGGFKVTGGGQIITEEGEQAGEKGDTVGFNAHRISEDGPEARGQFQYVPRGASDNDSAPTEKFHGVVTCLISAGEAQQNEMDEPDGEENEALTAGARFGGFDRDSNQAFTVDVTDNGQGGDSEDDMILVRLTSEPCADNPEDEDNDPEQMIRLGRGNVKIHNNPDGAATPASIALTQAAMVKMAAV